MEEAPIVFISFSTEGLGVILCKEGSGETHLLHELQEAGKKKKKVKANWSSTGHDKRLT